jgi:CubicO group peptidase (beta-lactamase class C family)
MKKIVLIVSLVCVATCQVQTQEITKITDSLVNACFENAEFTGTVLIAKGGKVLLKKGYGYSDVEHQVPNDAQTIYNIASITKPFTAALVLKLQEAGKLSVQDKLVKYYPDFPNAEKITIHHLLTHTSGVFNYTDEPAFWKMDQTAAQTLPQMIAWFKDKPLHFEPGARFQYSNSGYTLLGYIIEQVTGTTYARALEQYIFKPLGMHHSSYGPPANTSHLAKGYMMYYRNFNKTAPAVHPSISYATGAIYSTAEDLYKWHMALQKGKFLLKQSLAAMYFKDKGPYGYGWFTDSLYGKQRVLHDGKIPGFKSILIRIPQDDVSVIVLSNANNTGGDMIGNILNILYHQPLTKSFADWPVLHMPDSLKKEFTGIYKFRKEDSVQVLVRLQDSNLFIQIPGNQEQPLELVKRNVFRAGNARVEFMRNGTGVIEQIMVFSHGDIMGSVKIQ